MAAKMMIRKKNGSQQMVEVKLPRKDDRDEIWLPKTSVEAMSMVLSRTMIPAGAGQHKPAKTNRWKKGAQARNRLVGRTSSTISFNLRGECKGQLEQIWLIAKPLYQVALAEGNNELAKAILDKMQRIPHERELLRRKRQLERMIAKLNAS